MHKGLIVSQGPVGVAVDCSRVALPLGGFLVIVV